MNIQNIKNPDIKNQDIKNPINLDVAQPMSRFGEERVALARIVTSILDKSKHQYFLDSGTLIGLWRDGALIDKDDDFDLGVLVDEIDFTSEWLVKLQTTLQCGLRSTRFKARVVDTYTKKVEVFDPLYGAFVLEGDRYDGADFHHVTVDVQPHVCSGGGVTIPHNDFVGSYIPLSVYEPFDTLRFGTPAWDWRIPADPRAFLTSMYGYIGHGAKFDAMSKLYRLDLDMSGPLRVYTDMCADLFHAGHVRYLEKCKQIGENIHLIVGLHDDKTIESYKRPPICTLAERAAVVEACVHVDEVVLSAPLRITNHHITEHNIDIVVHSDGIDGAERHAMYAIPIEMGRYTEVPRTPGISTTEILDRVASRLGCPIYSPLDFRPHIHSLSD